DKGYVVWTEIVIGNHRVVSMLFIALFKENQGNFKVQNTCPAGATFTKQSLGQSTVLYKLCPAFFLHQQGACIKAKNNIVKD
ncbi:MAG: hypothetical protein KAV87_15105, partial [Desulfobacteraceae bacterium]|nr:hypothetical protein [Desulfobacteraceae bacterium]